MKIFMKMVRIEEDIEVFTSEKAFNDWLQDVNNEHFEFLIEDGVLPEDACAQKGYDYKWKDLEECSVHFE